MGYFKFKAYLLAFGLAFCSMPVWAEPVQDSAGAEQVQQSEQADSQADTIVPNNTQSSLTSEDTSSLDISVLGPTYTLEDSIDKAMKQNPAIRAADENVTQANAKYEQVKSNKNWTFGVRNNTYWQNKQWSGPTPVIEGLSDQLQASFSKLLTTFGSMESQIDAAYINIGVEALNAAATKSEMRYKVKQAFFNRLEADASVNVADLNIDVCKQSLSDSEKMYARGVMAKYDVIQADLNLTEAEEQKAKAEKDVNVANSAFLALLNEQSQATEDAPVTLVTPHVVDVDPTVTVDDLVKLGWSRRFEMLSLDRSIEWAKKMREAAEKSNRPEVSLSANYIFSPGYRTQTCSIYQLCLGIAWSPLDGGYRKAKVAEIDSQIRAIEAQRDQMALTIRQSVETAWYKFKLTDITLETSKKRVEAAWVYHDMARQRFLNGLGTSLEVQDALKNLNDARQALVVATYERDLAFAELEYSVGTDFPDRRLAVTPDMFIVNEE